MRFARWLSFLNRRLVRPRTSKRRERRRDARERFECLEERTVLSGNPIVNYDRVAPAWFETVTAATVAREQLDVTCVSGPDDGGALPATDREGEVLEGPLAFGVRPVPVPSRKAARY